MFRLLFICFFLTLPCLLGCSNGGGSNKAVFENNTPTPVANPNPTPTPFTPVETPRGIMVPNTDDLSIDGNVLHSFNVLINNIVGTGSLAATNIEFPSSGIITGLPVAISFSNLVQVSPTTFSATGFFSDPLCGPGTVTTTVIYTEGANTTLLTNLNFTVGTNSSCGGIDPGDDDDDDDVTPSSEILTNHDGVAEVITSFGSANLATFPKGFLVYFTSSLTPPFFITDITYSLFDSTLSSSATINAVAYADGDAPSASTEIGSSTLPAGSAFSPLFTGTFTASTAIEEVFSFSLSPPILISTSSFYAGIELPSSGNDVFMGKDTTTTTMDSWLFAGTTFIDNDTSGLSPGHWLISVVVSTVP
jgi:hypothetical protein